MSCCANSGYNPASESTALRAESDKARPRVLVTRPEHQSEGFCKLLVDAGFTPLRCPTVEISAVQTPQKATEQLAYAAHSRLIIVTSANAVRHAQQLTPFAKLSERATTLAVGPATATALQQAGIEALLPHESFTSEGLLAMRALQDIIGQKVLLVRGVGGLETLPKALRARGALLQIAEVYRRHIPVKNTRLTQIFHTELPQIISTTSNETLANLVTLTPVDLRPCLWPLPVVVNSERGEQLARSLGFCGDILRASPVGDHGQINTLKAWITQRLTQR